MTEPLGKVRDKRAADAAGFTLRLEWNGGNEVQLAYPAAWGASYRQSAHLLGEEMRAWLKTAWTLKVQSGA